MLFTALPNYTMVERSQSSLRLTDMARWPTPPDSLPVTFVAFALDIPKTPEPQRARGHERSAQYPYTNVFSTASTYPAATRSNECICPISRDLDANSFRSSGLCARRAISAAHSVVLPIGNT